MNMTVLANRVSSWLIKAPPGSKRSLNLLLWYKKKETESGIPPHCEAPFVEFITGSSQYSYRRYYNWVQSHHWPIYSETLCYLCFFHHNFVNGVTLWNLNSNFQDQALMAKYLTFFKACKRCFFSWVPMIEMHLLKKDSGWYFRWAAVSELCRLCYYR